MKNLNKFLAVNIVLTLMGLMSVQAQTGRNLSFDMNQLLLFGGDPNKVPVEEDPGPNAEVKMIVIHEKDLIVDSRNLKFKWTQLGYGQETEKVIVPELANHTLFNHRNPGEDGPCLRSFRTRFGLDNNLAPVKVDEDIVINIKAQNRYEINRAKKICRVSMVETVKTEINGIEFSHEYSKPMGFRFIEDCL